MEPTTGISAGNNETVRNTRTSFLIHFFNVIQSFQKHTHASSHNVCGMWTGIESFKLLLNSIGKVEVLRSLFGQTTIQLRKAHLINRQVEVRQVLNF